MSHHKRVALAAEVERLSLELAAAKAALHALPRLSVPTRVPTPGDAPRLDARRAQIDQEPKR